MNINEALETLCCQGGSWSGSGAFDEEIQCVIETVTTLQVQLKNSIKTVDNLTEVLGDSLASNRILEDKIIDVEFKNEGLEEDIKSLQKQLEEANHILIELEASSKCVNKDEIKEYLDDYLI